MTVKPKPYNLELITTPIVRTHWWKPSGDYEKQPSNVWWLTGGWVNRAATDVEIELWKRLKHAEGERLDITNAYAEEFKA